MSKLTVVVVPRAVADTSRPTISKVAFLLTEDDPDKRPSAGQLLLINHNDYPESM